MLCRRCEVPSVDESGGDSRRSGPTPARVWGVERLGGLLCTGCGAVLAAVDIAQRLLLKHSQLAQFGLVGAGPLLKSNHREDP